MAPQLQPHHARSLIAWGVAPLPRHRDRVDTWAREELREHAAALCRALHGHGDPRTCPLCRTNLTAPRRAS